MRRHRSLASLVALATSVFALAASAQPSNNKTSDQAAASTPDKPADTGSKADAKKAGDKDSAAKPDAKKKKADKANAGKKQQPEAAKSGEKKSGEAKSGEAKPGEEKAGNTGKAKPGAKKAGAASGGAAASGAAPGAAAGGAASGAAAAGATPGAQPNAGAAAPGAPAAGAPAAGSNASAGAAGAAAAGAAAPGAGAAPAAAAPPATKPPPPAPPPPAAAAPAPVVPAPAPGNASPTKDNGTSGGKKAPKHPPQTTLGIEIDAGTNARLDGGTPGFSNHEAADLTFGGGVWFAPKRLYSLGLSFQHAGIGSETSPPIGDSIAVSRDLNTLWLGGRAYPLRSDKVGLYIGLDLGASWQHVNATGTTVSGQFVASPKPFSCSASQGPGIAIGGNVGADVDLDSHLAFLANAGFAAHRLSSDLGTCAPGSGSVTDFAAQIGFMYRFDLDSPKSTATASSKHVVGRF